ncbi:rhomboid family intramembrane serine protease [Olleya sp. YS]|uniref:rhomboid family intramembrane serine protease n=1 Tax=Olleya sp. YS TaxID=3028318 RepID=UPI0024346035|nr:rhomboid family intramembrane serine protease [Olleya sp. YS]WGD34243.1 rhomboid family intramembrane serine protease [Olleya sp. YS]
MGNLDIITIIIIAANVIISYKGFEDFEFFDKYKFNVGAIKRGEQIRIFSSGFLHVNPQHLLFNMITLYFFAWMVIRQVGETKFVIIYVVSLLSGSLLSLVFNKDNYHYSAVGASGAVMGIIYSAILFDPWMEINFIIPGWLFGIGYLLYSIYGMKKQIGNIGHDAHFGGAVGGYATTLILAPILLERDLKMVLILAIPIVVLFVMQKLGKI